MGALICEIEVPAHLDHSPRCLLGSSRKLPPSRPEVSSETPNMAPSAAPLSTRNGACAAPMELNAWHLGLVRLGRSSATP